MREYHCDYDNQKLGKPADTTAPVDATDSVAPPRQRKVLPPPGRPRSFEEALRSSSEDNKELLRRLAQ